MPTVVTVRGYRLFFFSSEGDPREPAHVHVQKGRGYAKYWLEDGVRLDRAKNLSRADLGELESIVREYREEALRRWHEHFGS